MAAAKKKPALRVVRSEAREELARRIASRDAARASVEEAREAAHKAFEEITKIEAEQRALIDKHAARGDAADITALSRGELNAVKQSKSQAEYHRRAAELDEALSNLRRLEETARKAIPEREKEFEMACYFVKSQAQTVLDEEVAADVESIVKRLAEHRAAMAKDLRKAHAIANVLPVNGEAYRALVFAINKPVDLGGNVDVSGEGRPYAAFFEALQNDADAKL